MLDVQHSVPIRLGLWQRIVLHHKQRFSEHPRVISIMLIWSVIRLFNLEIGEWPINVPLCYFWSFVFVPAFFKRDLKVEGVFPKMLSDASAQTFSHADSHRSPFGVGSIHQESFSRRGPGDLNRYHPHSAVNRSSPFYRK